jgi:hypothetical protein
MAFIKLIHNSDSTLELHQSMRTLRVVFRKVIVFFLLVYYCQTCNDLIFPSILRNQDVDLPKQSPSPSSRLLCQPGKLFLVP